MERDMTNVLQAMLVDETANIRITSVDHQVSLGNSRLKLDHVITLQLNDAKERVAMEMDGQQHFIPVEFFGGETTLDKRRKCDQQKDQLLETNHIHLLRIDFTVAADTYAQHVRTFLETVTRDPHVWHYTCVGQSYTTQPIVEEYRLEPDVSNRECVVPVESNTYA